MDEPKIVKLAELRSRMAAIPVKLLLSFLIAAGAVCQFSLDRFKENIPENIVVFFMIYGILSYFWLFIKMTGNWIIGIIAAVALIFIWQYNVEKMGEAGNTLIGAVICFGGPVLDFFTIVRYFFLKKHLFSQMGDYGEYEEYDDYDDEESYEEDYIEDYEDDYEDDYIEDDEEYRRSKVPSYGFFSGCRDAASIKRRYRDLCKVYHPDAGNGSSEVFNKITEEYNRLIKEV